MILLSDREFVAKGSTRYCYRHPDNPDRCIKIPHELSRGHKQNRDDARYFKLLERRGVEWCHIPHCHGWVETNVGTGLVFDFFHTPTGFPLPSIARHLKRGHITVDQMAEPLEELKRYLLANRIIIRDLNGTNIVCDVAASDAGRLYLIDGIGNADYIKLANVIPLFARKKIERHWTRFINKLSARNPVPVMRRAPDQSSEDGMEKHTGDSTRNTG